MASGILELLNTLKGESDEHLAERHLALARIDAQYPNGDPTALYAVEQEMRRRGAGMVERMASQRAEAKMEERIRRTQAMTQEKK